MYAIVKTGGKQYKVAPGDTLNVEKLPGEAGDTVALDAICIVDGKKVESDPSKAAATKVEAVIVDQFKDKKVMVFKFKKRKNYKKLRGHRQPLTKIQITAVGSEKYTAPKKETKAKKTAKDTKADKTAAAPKAETAKKTTAKTTAAKTTKKATETKTTKATETKTTKATETKTTKATETKAKTASKTSTTKKTTAKAKTAAAKDDKPATEEKAE